jgi:citrate synthase
MKESIYLTAKEAAKELEVSLPTLYAYVSRGLIRSESGDDSRLRRYRKEDILAIKQRKELRQNPSKAAEAALDWGTPVLSSEISLISEGNLYYRGKNVIDLAENFSFEEVASLIWLKDITLPFAALRGNSYNEKLAKIHKELLKLSYIESFQALLPIAASFDLAAYDLRPLSVANTGAQILRLFATIVCKGKENKSSIAENLEQGWGAKQKGAAKLINAALILCADHELNASTFTARCVASTGANPYLVVSAGLAALQGYKHGGQSEQAEALFRETSNPDMVTSILASRLRRGEKIPGFGHSLYPEGDPRAKLLIKLAKEFAPNSVAVKLGEIITKEVHSLTGEPPTLDAGLAILTQTLNLPLGATITLFAIGRTVGWIGHSIEEYQTNRLIRPRAKYTGVQP